MINKVIRFQDGMVLVFDEKREQMPELQGRYEQVRVKILARAPRSAKFFHGTWAKSTPEHLKAKFVEPLSPVLRKEW
ncbi:unnamed protein product [marine sediment metagenome]|uniref:Uncharacterized protein n=1 Tax=marine sediment metagenome TaxID=412755 RepID=X1SD07_9ZZZZ